MTRVLVVDDSPGMRELLIAILSSEPGLSVAGVAADGEEAIQKTIELRPDVISMDLRMPRMDGVRAIRAIMNSAPTPIVVLHARRGSSGPLDIGFDALRAGALEVVEKPILASAEDVRAFRRSYGTLLKLMAEVKVIRLLATLDSEALTAVPSDHSSIGVVGVCSSTGGPSALERVFSHLPSDFPIPIFVVQHMTEGFLDGFVEWMDRNGPLTATVAVDGETPRAGVIYFAPDFMHLTVGHDGKVRTISSAAVRGHLPSGDVLFDSLAAVYGDRTIGVVLTGMGEDGARGASSIAAAGGVVIAQDESSSIVYGMPRAVVDLGVACEVLPLDAIALRIVDWVTSTTPPTHESA